MKHKKVFKTLALTAGLAVLLTGCSGSEDNPDSNNGGNSNQPTTYLTVADFRNNQEALIEHPNISSYFSRFNQETSDSLEDELVAASVATYLDNTAYNYYFISDWWGLKDDFSDKGFQHFEGNVTESLLDEIKTLNKDKDKDPLSATYFYHLPSIMAEQGYQPAALCYETWEPSSCMNPYMDETISIVSSNAHRAVVEVTSTYTVYVDDEFGAPHDQEVVYTATLELENNKSLTDVKEQPFYVVKKVEGGYTYGDPYQAN